MQSFYVLCHGNFVSVNQTYKLKRNAKFGYFWVLKQIVC